MGVYRVEASPNNRAGCHTKPCKEAGVKITKGELRYAIQVTINEHQSWQYRHWGCVTPKQIENLVETCGGDTDMVDGFDELPAEYQEKIVYALGNGHVHDDDWKGDPELNRPGKSGIKKRAPKKKAKKDADDEEGVTDDNEDHAEQPKKKRASKAKAKTEDDADVAPAPAAKKRGRAVKKEAADEDEEVTAPLAKKTRGRPAKKVEYKEESDEDEAPPPKKARGKKAVVKVQKTEDVEDENEDLEVEEEAPKPKRGIKKAAAANGDGAKAPQKKGRKKKATTADE